MAAVTRLGPGGGPRGLYGSFAGKTEQVIVEIAAKTAGGRRRKGRGRYPRRIYIDGRIYVAQNAEEERRLLTEWRNRVEAEAIELALEEAPKAEIARARVKVVRAARRLEQVDDREDEWISRLRREDEEILAVLLH